MTATPAVVGLPDREFTREVPRRVDDRDAGPVPAERSTP